MERNNERQRQRLKNKENARLRKLVETAYRLDPRVIVQKEAAKKKKEVRNPLPYVSGGKRLPYAGTMAFYRDFPTTTSI